MCVTMSLIGDETTQTADQHINLLSYFLTFLDKSFEKVTALFGDDCSTNKSVASNLKKLLIRCSSHHFQLKVREFTWNKDDAKGRAHLLMTELRTTFLQARLYQQTTLRAKLSNDARWISVYEMLQRHVALRDHVAYLDDVDLGDFVLPATSERRIDALLMKVEELSQVVLELLLSHAR